MIAVFLVLVQQGQAPTVGDTIWISRTVAAQAGAEVRPASWELTGDLMVLGRPVVERDDGRVRVRYPVAAWTPGEHRLEVPGPIVIRPDGRTDSLPPETVTIQVGSVLPAGTEAATAQVRPPNGLVAETVTTPVPLAATLGLALLAFLPFAWWWRRRRAPAKPVTAGHDGAVAIPAGDWAEDGESRAVAATTAREVRQSLTAVLPGAQPGLGTGRLLAQAETRRPALPVEDLEQTLRSLEAVAYGDAPPDDVESLAARARALSSRLQRPAQ